MALVRSTIFIYLLNIGSKGYKKAKRTVLPERTCKRHSSEPTFILCAKSLQWPLSTDGELQPEQQSGYE